MFYNIFFWIFKYGVRVAITCPLEETQTSEKTVVLRGEENTTRAILQLAANTRRNMNVCADSLAPSLSVGVPAFRQGLVDLVSRGVEYRYITEITRENLGYCKELAKYVKLRHLHNVMGNFVVTEREYIATAVVTEEAKPVPEVIYSSVRSIVDQQRYLFLTLWNTAVPAEQRIREIEEGIQPEFMEVISDKSRAAQLLLQIAKSVKKQALFVLPNDRAVLRVDRLGVLKELADAANRGADVRIICPLSDLNSHLIESYKNRSKMQFARGNIMQTGIIIADCSIFQSTEMVNSGAEDFIDAAGTTLYSNSRRTIATVVAFFDSLWNQSELLHRLEVQENREKEFVNIAAHELRTPVQPLLSIAEFLLGDKPADGKPRDPEEKVLVTRSDIEMIARNAKRLERLTSDVLEVSRIEGKTLKLNIEVVDLNAKIASVVRDARLTLNGKGVEIVFNQNEDAAPILVRCDRSRIFAVLANLIDNAIKFTDHGKITVTAEKTQDAHQAIVIVTDTGAGIDSEILPGLFGKFVSKSDKGTGLGLYLSKSVIEAHGGRIWAENNANGIGAKFSFTLPLSN